MLKIYVSDLDVLSICMLSALLLWSLLSALFPRAIKVAAVALGVLSVAVIAYSTVFSRDTGVYSTYLVPFSSFERAKLNPEIYRAMLMNVYFFLPLGMSLPFLLKSSTTKRILLTVLVGLAVSLAVELAQHFFSLGVAEIDDVICNTLGTLLGSMSYLLSLLLKQLTAKLRNRKQIT